MIYLDNNATTAPCPEAIEAANAAFTECWGNPSSIHRFGQAVRQAMELARLDVCNLIGCSERELIFTSGATEANNLAISGILARRGDRKCIVTTSLEHAAIREPCERLVKQGYEIIHAPFDDSGTVVVDQFRSIIESRADEIALVTIHWANNETGVIQPIQAIGETCSGYGIPVHTDATQAVGKIPLSVRDVNVSALSMSAHKFHGIKGIGALFVKSGSRIQPQTIGGPQERERRGGTENVPGILAMGAAAKAAKMFIESGDAKRIASLRDRFESRVLEALPTTLVNASGAHRLWNTTNLAFPPLESEAILLLLSERGLCASAGAACSSGSLEPSPVLLSLGIAEEAAHGSVRFSLSRYTTEDQIDQAVEIVTAAILKLRKSMPSYGS